MCKTKPIETLTFLKYIYISHDLKQNLHFYLLQIILLIHKYAHQQLETIMFIKSGLD